MLPQDVFKPEHAQDRNIEERERWRGGGGGGAGGGTWEKIYTEKHNRVEKILAIFKYKINYLIFV